MTFLDSILIIGFFDNYITAIVTVYILKVYRLSYSPMNEDKGED